MLLSERFICVGLSTSENAVKVIGPFFEPILGDPTVRVIVDLGLREANLDISFDIEFQTANFFDKDAKNGGRLHCKAPQWH